MFKSLLKFEVLTDFGFSVVCGDELLLSTLLLGALRDARMAITPTAAIHIPIF